MSGAELFKFQCGDRYPLVRVICRLVTRRIPCTLYNPQNEACGTSQTKRTPTHPAEKKRSVTFLGNIPRAFGNHPNALLASVK
nr:MAG TPA: hypothetical protein [Caudoviricetes sp.]